MGEILEIAKVLVDPVSKLFDMVGNAIGTVYEPHHIRKMADAEAYKIKTIGEAISDMAVLPTSYDNGAIALSSTDTDDLLRRAAAREKQQKIREQKNIENVIDIARQELLTSPPIADTPVDDDWMNRLISNAKEVSSETMQFIWGKILAGEIVSPGKFSKRTLETIRNLSQEEASVFQKMLPYFVDIGNSLVFIRNDKIQKKYNIAYGELLLLDECGLMTIGQNVARSMDIFSDNEHVVHNNSYMLCASCPDGKPNRMEFPVYKLTTAGNELCKILFSDHNNDYFMDVVEDIASLNKNIPFKLYKINGILDDTIDYETPAIKEYNLDT